MKKIILSVFIFMITLFLASCGQATTEKQIIENSVKIKKISATQESTNAKIAKSLRKLSNNIAEETVIQYILLNKNQTDTTFTIELDNPEAYGIDSLRITCDDPDSQILMDDVWSPIQRESDGTTVVNWASENPYTKTYQIRTTSEDSENTFKVVDIRLAGHEKFQSKETDSENLGNNELTIYKILDNAYTVETISNKVNLKTLSVTVNDENISNFKINGLDADDNGYWYVTESGEALISYDYTVIKIEKTFQIVDKINIINTSVIFYGDLFNRETSIFYYKDYSSSKYILCIDISIYNADSVTLFFDGEEYTTYENGTFEIDHFTKASTWELKEKHNALIETSFHNIYTKRFKSENDLSNFIDKVVLEINGIKYKFVYDIVQEDKDCYLPDLKRLEEILTN